MKLNQLLVVSSLVAAAAFIAPETKAASLNLSSFHIKGYAEAEKLPKGKTVWNLGESFFFEGTGIFKDANVIHYGKFATKGKGLFTEILGMPDLLGFDLAKNLDGELDVAYGFDGTLAAGRNKKGAIALSTFFTENVLISYDPMESARGDGFGKSFFKFDFEADTGFYKIGYGEANPYKKPAKPVNEPMNILGTGVALGLFWLGRKKKVNKTIV